MILESHLENHLETNLSLLCSGGKLISINPYTESNNLANGEYQVHVFDVLPIVSSFLWGLFNLNVRLVA